MVDAQLSRLAQTGRQGTPAAITFALVFLSLIPFGLPHIGLVMPPLALMAVYFWGIYRPDLLPGPAVFALGLLQDVLSGGPIGLYAGLYVGVHAVMSSQRRVFLGRAFTIEWFGFTVVAVGTFLLVWVVASVYYGKVLRPAFLGVQALLSVALYPALAWAMIRVRRAVSQI